MNVGDTYPVWKGVLQFTFYQNSGAARSSFQGFGTYFGIFGALFVISILVYRTVKGAESRTLDFGLAMLVGGAAGNAVERLLFGKVTDFIEFGSGRGILNLADLSINIGVLAIIGHSLFFSKKRREESAG